MMSLIDKVYNMWCTVREWWWSIHMLLSIESNRKKKKKPCVGGLAGYRRRT